ncbi:MAG: DNA recombination protein RmuC [Planctomycetota bacterium]
MPQVLLITLIVLVLGVVVLQVLMLVKARPGPQEDAFTPALDRLERELANLPKAYREEALQSRKEAGELAAQGRDEQGKAAKDQREELSAKFNAFSLQVKDNVADLGTHQQRSLKDFAERLEKLTGTTEQKADALRQMIEKKLDQLQQSNEQKLEKMRQTVDEKLQTTLDKRLGESFKLVSDRLEKVQRGLGEMQELATGVGDLKRVMTNVKTRGVYGEFSLENIITQTLTQDQYEKEYSVKPETGERVDFVVKIPDEDGRHALLPIDSKFPIEDFERIQQAEDPKSADEARRALEKRVLGFAKELAGKYLIEPVTTPYMILFVPTEGLYAELISRATLFEDMQRLRVMLAGPTNLMAMLHTVQVMYRNQAIEKHAQEIGQMLGVVKNEFGQFEEIALKMQKKLEGTAKDFNEKIGRRARAMGRALKTIDAGADQSPIAQLMGLEEDEPAEIETGQEPEGAGA